MKKTMKEKIIQEVQKNFTISKIDTFDGYCENQTHFSIKELPNWLFAIWEEEDSKIHTFCEHLDLIDKFKIGRCYNDEVFTYMSKYITDIKEIIENEPKAYFISNYGLDSWETGEYEEQEWKDDRHTEKAGRMFRMYATRVRRQKVLKEKNILNCN
jgi:hypothetical protein